MPSRTNRTIKRVLGGALLTLLVTTTTAYATVIKNLEFNVDGVLPSSEPDVELFNNSGLLESNMYSVSAGLLQQRTFGIGTGNVSYQSPNVGLSLGNLDPAQTLTIEARLSVLAIEGATGAYFQAFNGIHRYQVSFSSGAVSLFNSANTYVSFPILDLAAFHVYRLESPGNSSTMSLYVDNVLALTASAPGHTLNGFGFGDGITASGNNANVDWDYLRVSQMPLQVPEPATFALTLIGLAGIVGLRRRRAIAADLHDN